MDFLKPHGYKYRNRITVSYPEDMVTEIIRECHVRKISAQDLQRRAMEYYLRYMKQLEELSQTK